MESLSVEQNKLRSLNVPKTDAVAMTRLVEKARLAEKGHLMKKLRARDRTLLANGPRSADTSQSRTTLW